MFSSAERLLANDGSGRLVVDVKISGRPLQHLRREVGEVPGIIESGKSSLFKLIRSRSSTSFDVDVKITFFKFTIISVGL
jgi:hypothetical protein